MTTIDSDLPAIDRAWNDRMQRAHERYPRSAAPPTFDVTRLVVRGEELLAVFIRDMLALDNVASQRGHRPDLDLDDGRQLLAELRGQDYSVERFDVAFRALAGRRSLATLARMTGLGKTNISRLLNNRKAPKPAEMEAIAAAFRKRPVYFAEYRAAAFASLIQQHLADNPDRSAVITHQFGLRGN